MRRVRRSRDRKKTSQTGRKAKKNDRKILLKLQIMSRIMPRNERTTGRILKASHSRGQPKKVRRNLTRGNLFLTQKGAIRRESTAITVNVKGRMRMMKQLRRSLIMFKTRLVNSPPLHTIKKWTDSVVIIACCIEAGGRHEYPIWKARRAVEHRHQALNGHHRRPRKEHKR